MPDSPALDALRALARDLAARAYVPYSREPEAALALLRDGRFVPGVRVENAAYPLTIAAVLGALAAWRAADPGDVVAVVASRPFTDGERALVAEVLGRPLTALAPDVLADDEALSEHDGTLPAPTTAVSPFLDAPVPRDDDDGNAAGAALAARVAEGAYAPFSHFPVGAVLALADGQLVPGVNVEHADWARGLCAERVALTTARAHGLGPPARLFVACPTAPGGTPCGACRQVIAELAPGIPVVIARGDAPPDVTTPEALLPGAFGSAHLGAPR